MASGRQVLGPRSSLLSHVFPPFYACYLLKSIQTPKSKATYIGSTPSPPRRIRQHNGELKQGAWKTRLRRPWVMQMIVHGFPSRLAALQFEWAWQHPHKSRHLRDANGEALFANRSSRNLGTNVQIVRTMIAHHPYRTWPLHVKLFTEEAVMAWKEATPDIAEAPLPLGFTCSIELEGVDGKSGKAGSGRCGPINVNDEQFTSSYLSKNTTLLASNRDLKCCVCQELLPTYVTDTVSTSLCPEPSCTAVSHISCLAKHFLETEPTELAIIPRGGSCPCCNTYILWGDIIRGSYRRMAGGILPKEDELYESDDDPYADATSPRSPVKESTKGKVRGPLTRTRKPRETKAKRMGAATSSSEGEFFDLDVSSADELPHNPPKRARPPKTVSHAAALTGTPKATTSPAKKGRSAQKKVLRAEASSSSEGELFDPDDDPDEPSVSPGQLGRPRQVMPAVPAAVVRTARGLSPSEENRSWQESRRSSSTEEDLFNSDASSSENTPRKRGRPRKAPSSAAPPTRTSQRTTENSATFDELPELP
ncbi:putative catalytic subunit of the SLX1-SLX4 structure-specific endonuclease that resolves DNA secondary structures generated during DNA repair and recombination [Lyophyllum shimeji]|uniref:Catalytic subunit of the SLX1-SLX4 structure-specific endonuclease that resolves DNA secondary structures generated during DNA repair and recombination n=1 Tax=Lyophyllum shimeji TaxID=47721 RepID=A0A9P3UL53_LYOSH|nr:putative catalytic subunit of the SLX1-SLX4 structure-specific endonuclease that resolves DNA secondary structures generated during DNA repair and recombination [Lyophyllum shimeji]